MEQWRLRIDEDDFEQVRESMFNGDFAKTVEWYKQVEKELKEVEKELKEEMELWDEI